MTPPLRSALVALILAAPCAAAQEFAFLTGPQWDISQSNPATYQWRLDYQQGLGPHYYWEVGWINDGHVPGHARDGVVAQIGMRTTLFSPKFVIGLASGVDRFYDTVEDSLNPGNFADVQAFLWITSAQLSFYAGRWIIRAQSNLEIAPSTSYNGLSALIGLGYQMQNSDAPGARAWPLRQTEFTTHNEVTVYVGQTVPNGGSSDPKGIAWLAEYRHGVWRNFDLSFSFINQGDNAVLARTGIASQIWPTRAFGPVVLGLGLGAFFAVNGATTDSNGEPYPEIAGLISPTASYRFGEHWRGRFLWNRTVTTNNTNTDFFSLGLGYGW